MRMLDVGICGTDKEIVSFAYGTAPPDSPYLIIGHESLGEVVQTGASVTRVKPGDLAVATVRRPCEITSCIACRAERPDFCYSGEYTERGIQQRHGYMTEFVVEEERFLNPVPRGLRDVAVLVEPLTIAEKGIGQLWQIQQRLPWPMTHRSQRGSARRRTGGVTGSDEAGDSKGSTLPFIRAHRRWEISKSLVTSIGAKFAPAETVTVEALARQTGSIDVVYEAVGASSLAFDDDAVSRHERCIYFHRCSREIRVPFQWILTR